MWGEEQSRTKAVEIQKTNLFIIVTISQLEENINLSFRISRANQCSGKQKRAQMIFLSEVVEWLGGIACGVNFSDSLDVNNI